MAPWLGRPTRISKAIDKRLEFLALRRQDVQHELDHVAVRLSHGRLIQEHMGPPYWDRDESPTCPDVCLPPIFLGWDDWHLMETVVHVPTQVEQGGVFDGGIWERVELEEVFIFFFKAPEEGKAMLVMDLSLKCHEPPAKAAARSFRRAPTMEVVEDRESYSPVEHCQIGSSRGVSQHSSWVILVEEEGSHPGLVVGAHVGPVWGRFGILGGLCKLCRHGNAKIHVACKGGHDRPLFLGNGGAFRIAGVLWASSSSSSSSTASLMALLWTPPAPILWGF